MTPPIRYHGQPAPNAERIAALEVLAQADASVMLGRELTHHEARVASHTVRLLCRMLLHLEEKLYDLRHLAG